MRPFQWSSMQRIVAFVRDILLTSDSARVDCSAASLPRQEAGVAGFSGGQFDSERGGVGFQITNVQFGCGYHEEFKIISSAVFSFQRSFEWRMFLCFGNLVALGAAMFLRVHRLNRSHLVQSPAPRAVCILLATLLLAAATPITLLGQLKTTVSIATAKTGPVVYTTSIGVAADRWDAKAFDAPTRQLLRDAGITNLRFPGNNGISELYHFSTGAVVNPYTSDRAPDFATERKFPAMVAVIDRLGSALVSVNYGTNLDASGGGEPAEAAAWVAYANGKPSSTQAIGKDSKGNDWKTVGYWAGLRASAPLPTDDGLNALRISHSDPIGIPMWTIGNEIWNNGFYGQIHSPGSDA